MVWSLIVISTQAVISWSVGLERDVNDTSAGFMAAGHATISMALDGSVPDSLRPTRLNFV